MSESLERLVHDVNSKCASLRDAVRLLKDSPRSEADELLTLMVAQAEDLARAISRFKAGL